MKTLHSYISHITGSPVRERGAPASEVDTPQKKPVKQKPARESKRSKSPDRRRDISRDRNRDRRRSRSMSKFRGHSRQRSRSPRRRRQYRSSSGSADSRGDRRRSYRDRDDRGYYDGDYFRRDNRDRRSDASHARERKRLPRDPSPFSSSSESDSDDEKAKNFTTVKEHASEDSSDSDSYVEPTEPLPDDEKGSVEDWSDQDEDDQNKDGEDGKDFENERESGPALKKEDEPDKIMFRDIIRLISAYSEAELKTVATARSKDDLKLKSEDGSGDKEEFLGLTTASGVKLMLETWQTDFVTKDNESGKDGGIKALKLFRNKAFRPSMKPYQSGDGFVGPPLKISNKKYEWLESKGSLATITESDLVYLENEARDLTQILNFKELLNQVLNRAIREPENFDQPIMVQLHACAKKADKDLLQLSVQILGSISQLRKDSNLLRAKVITDEQRDRLRHSSMTDTTDLFDPAIVNNVDAEYRQDITTKGLSAAVSGAKSNRNSKSRSEYFKEPIVAKS